MGISAEDCLQIQELVARALIGLDSEDAGEFAATFVEDGVFVAPYGEFTGPAAIAAFLQGHIAAGNEHGVRHFVTNHVIDVHPEGARHRFYILKMNVLVGPVAIATGGGDCIVKRTDKGWRFKRYQLSVDAAIFGKAKPALSHGFAGPAQ